MFCLDRLGFFRGHPGDHDGILLTNHGLHDTQNLHHRFALTENHFRKAFSQGSVVIHARIGEILKGEVFQFIEGRFDTEAAARDRFQDFSNGFGIHEL